MDKILATNKDYFDESLNLTKRQIEISKLLKPFFVVLRPYVVSIIQKDAGAWKKFVEVIYKNDYEKMGLSKVNQNFIVKETLKFLEATHVNGKFSLLLSKEKVGDKLYFKATNRYKNRSMNFPYSESDFFESPMFIAGKIIAFVLMELE